MERAVSETVTDERARLDEDSLSVTPRSSSTNTTPAPSSKSKTNLISKFGVNRKRSRASEERVVTSRSSGGQLRSLTIPEHGQEQQMRSSPRLLETAGFTGGSHLSRPGSVTLVMGDHRPASPGASLSGDRFSNRDSLISSGSSHSDTGLSNGHQPPVLPPKHGIGRDGQDTSLVETSSVNGIE